MRQNRLGVYGIGLGLGLGLGLGCHNNGAAKAPPDLAIAYAAAYSLPLFDKTRISSQGGAANFQKATTDLNFHDAPFASAKLIIDLASTCYPFDSWRSNPPPAGQSWPADCDAFDRNFELTLDPAATASAKPGVEVLRAITPFGGPLHVEVDLTDVANGLPGAHTMQVVIPTWSDGAGKVSGSNGGWNVSAHLDMVPGAAPHKVLAVLPLLDGNQGAGDTPPTAQLVVPPGTTSTRLEYRATGHGGATDPKCIGPAEEFCQRKHHVLVDGAELAVLTPWRNDCDSLCTVKHQGAATSGFDYCLENPCGNMDSVRAPRANWCPGSVTPPATWDAPALRTAGAHSFTYSIDNEIAGGTWRLSATLFAFGD